MAKLGKSKARPAAGAAARNGASRSGRLGLSTTAAACLLCFLVGRTIPGGVRRDGPIADVPVAVRSVSSSVQSTGTVADGASVSLDHGSRPGYRLAYEESYGFFEEIPDHVWKRYQDWARRFPFHRYGFNPLQMYRNQPVWYYNSYEPYFSCPEKKRIGDIGDGPKWTCNVHRLATIGRDRWRNDQEAVAADTAYDDNKYGCLIYSVGSNGNYEWEDAMFKALGQKTVCEIHIFDYSRNYDRPVNKERNMHFHQWGFKGSKTTDQQLPKRARPDLFVDLFEITKRLGHENRVIDIFKIDCEGCEWTSYYDFVPYQNIRQVLVETHSLPEDGKQALVYFDSYADNNLIMYSKEVNPWGGGNCFEFCYIRLKPNFRHPANNNTSALAGTQQ